MKSREFLSALYRAAVTAVDPERLVSEALGRRGDAVYFRSVSAPTRREFVFLPDRIFLLSLGKAAVSMAKAAAQILEGRLDGALVIAPSGASREGLPKDFRFMEAAYPFPDERSATAGDAALSMASRLGSHDLLIVLLSGGGSSLMTAPVPGVSIEDKSQTAALLMAAGAPISDLNVVRGVLSRLKGGGLAAATPGGNIVTLVLSDVADGSWHLVASGPTLGTTPTKSEARSILDRYRLTPLVPSSVRNFLMDGLPAHQEVWASASRWSVLLGDIRTAIEGARVAALREGADVRVIPELLSGESSAAARRLAVAGACAGNLIRRGSGPHRRLVTLFGGETSLVGRGRKGRGGRNRSLALATALQIAGVEGAAALVAGTDGLDNGSDAAGAYVDSSTVSRAYEMGLDPRMSLETNETAGFFETLGDAFSPGPTGTYVGDVAFVLAPGSDEDRVEEEDDWVIPLPNVS